MTRTINASSLDRLVAMLDNNQRWACPVGAGADEELLVLLELGYITHVATGAHLDIWKLTGRGLGLAQDVLTKARAPK